MSTSLVEALLHNDDTFIHTARDDLESFVWVLIWQYLSIAQDRGCASKRESYSLSILSSQDYSDLFVVKLGMSHGATKSMKQNSFARSFSPLIKRWLLCVQSSKTPTSWDSVYEEFFSIAIECLEEANDWDSWDVFFGVDE